MFHTLLHVPVTVYGQYVHWCLFNFMSRAHTHTPMLIFYYIYCDILEVIKFVCYCSQLLHQTIWQKLNVNWEMVKRTWNNSGTATQCTVIPSISTDIQLHKSNSKTNILFLILDTMIWSRYYLKGIRVLQNGHQMLWNMVNRTPCFQLRI